MLWSSDEASYLSRLHASSEVGIVTPPEPAPPAEWALAKSWQRSALELGLTNSPSLRSITPAPDGGAYLNNEKVTDEDAAITGADLLAGGVVLVRRGRRNLAVARAK